MKKGKVVIIGGNKRSGKSTLGRMLQTQAGFNYYNMDHLTNSVDKAWFEDGLPLNNYFKYMESLIEYAISDANRYGINSVFEFIYTPEILEKLSCKDKVEIVYLANLDLTEDNFENILLFYSKEYEYSADLDNVKRNKDIILKRNIQLVDECRIYNTRLINTSYGLNRDKILNILFLELKQ